MPVRRPAWLPFSFTRPLASSSRRPNRLQPAALVAPTEQLEDRALLAATVLDPTFGGDGTVTTGFAVPSGPGSVASNDSAHAVQLQADGKLLVAGISRLVTGQFGFVDYVSIARYTVDGSLDQSFGNGGRSISSQAVGFSVVDLALDPNGSVYVAGTTGSESNTDFVVARYTAAAELDSSYGDGGLAIADFSFADQGQSVAVDDSGRAVVLGVTFDDVIVQFAIARFTASGELDPTFDGDGKEEVNFTGSEQGVDVAIDTLGRTIIAGGVSSQSGNVFAVARLTAGGVIDGSFGGGDGQVTIPQNGRAIAVDSAGRILIAVDTAGGENYAVVRLDPNGSVDLNFGTTGIAASDFSSFGTLDDATPTAIAIRPNGDIAVVGEFEDGPSGNEGFGLALFTTAGMLIRNFDGSGGQVAEFAGDAELEEVFAGPDNAIYVVGDVDLGPTDDFAVAKFALNFAPPLAFPDLRNVIEDDATVLNVLLNDRLDGPVRITAINGTSVQTGGAVTLADGTTIRVNSDNTLTYTPGPRFARLRAGQVASLPPFSYTVTNEDGESSTANVGIRVIGATRQLTAVALGPSGSGRPNDPVGGPRVVVYDEFGSELFNFLAFDADYTGGVRVAVGDVNRDGTPDIIATPAQVTPRPDGVPRLPEVVVYSGVDGSLIGARVLDFTYFVGAFVAAGDIDGDGSDDVILGADFGVTPRVQVLSFQIDGSFVSNGRVIADFNAFAGGFAGGVRVAAGDVDGDGRDDIVVGSGRGATEARIYSGQGVADIYSRNARRYADFEMPNLRSLFPFTAGFREGLFVAAGNVSGDSRAEVIVAPDLGGLPQVITYSFGSLSDGGLGPTSQQSFTAFGPQFRGGIRVAVGDANADGENEILTAAGFAPQPDVRAYTPAGVQVKQFPQIEPFFRRGTTIASGRATTPLTVPPPTFRLAASSVGDAFAAGLADDLLAVV